jgi:hypothetical protein
MNETNPNEGYYFHLDKSVYEIPKNYLHHKLKIKEWQKLDGQFVNKGDLVITLGYSSSYGIKETISHFSEKSGFLDIVREMSDFVSLDDNELIYIIHENDIDRINRKFTNVPNIFLDEFTGNKIIKWDRVAMLSGIVQGVSSKSIDESINFIFSFNNINKNDFIVFQFESKQIMLNKGDVISFLFDDNKIIDFKLDSHSYKSSHPFNQNLFENKIQITEFELNQFENSQFLKWKISIDKQNREIIGGNKGNYSYALFSNLVTVIKKLSKEYRQLVKKEVSGYKPLEKRTNNNDIQDEFQHQDDCFVYLMIDTINKYYKIGISNKPEWREKTLQSEKPTIELIASKKFLNRKIASSFEKALHNTYSEKRIRGEWFVLDLNEVNEIRITLLT